MISVYEYADDNQAYTILNEEQRQKVIDMLNHKLERIVKMRVSNNDFWAEDIKRNQAELDGMRSVLDALGMKVAQGWIGHRGTFFFPTYEDALAEEDWEWQCADYDYADQDYDEYE